MSSKKKEGKKKAKKEKKEKPTDTSAVDVEKSSQPKNIESLMNVLIAGQNKQSEFNETVTKQLQASQQRMNQLEESLQGMNQRAAQALSNVMSNGSDSELDAEMKKWLLVLQAAGPLLQTVFGSPSPQTSVMDDMMREMFKDSFKAFTQNTILSLKVNQELLKKLKKSEVKLE